MKSLTASYIQGIENLSQESILNALCSIPEHAISCVNWKEYPYAPKVTFHIAFSDKVIAILFKVTEDHVRAVTLEPNGPVWEDSCVEFFIDNPTDEKYFNFEMNCIGTMLASKRISRTEADHFGEELMNQIRNFGSLEHNKIDIQKAGQNWWRVELIPFSVIGMDKAPEMLKGNFYKCGDKCSKAHFLSWTEINLPAPNFHCPDYFGSIFLTK